MKKIFLFIIIIFISFNIYTKDEIDIAEVDENLYGIKEFSKMDEVNLNLMHFEFLPVLQKIIKDKSNINEIENFFNDVNNETLLGIFIRDSIIQYISEECNAELLLLLNNYIEKNDSQAIRDIFEIRKNFQNYARSNFCFSTVLSRKKIFKNISMITPNSEWKEVNFNKNTDSKRLMAGDDNYAGTIYIKYYKITKKNINISNDIFEAMQETILFKRSPEGGNLKKLKDDDLFKVKPGKVKMISENITIGTMTFDKLFEQITINSDKYNFQKFVERIRYYIKGTDLYVISLHSIIGGDHFLANKTNLIIQHGLLLDTVIFE